MVDGIEAQDAELFVDGIQEYLSPALRKEAMTLAQQFIKQGVRKGEVNVITHQLQCRFQQVPPAYLAKIEQADPQTLLSWSERILKAQSLEEIFE
jgi:hypothetical protein